jgi:hypothetical protein
MCSRQKLMQLTIIGIGMKLLQLARELKIEQVISKKNLNLSKIKYFFYLDDPSLLEVQYLPLRMNNLTILEGGKCPPGWSLVFDTCYMYVGAPMTFYEARDFCRSDNASLPFIRDDTTQLWAFLQQQMQHLR